MNLMPEGAHRNHTLEQAYEALNDARMTVANADFSEGSRLRKVQLENASMLAKDAAELLEIYLQCREGEEAELG